MIAHSAKERMLSRAIGAVRQVTNTLLTRADRNLNGRNGRGALIGDPAAFGVERPIEWPLSEQVGSPVMAGSRQRELRVRRRKPVIQDESDQENPDGMSDG